MSHGIYFSANSDKDGFRLPINPEIVTVTATGDGEQFTIAKVGTVNVPKDAKLDEFSIESYFPAMPTHYSTTDFRKPEFYINWLRKWKDSKQPIRYIYDGGSFPINELVTIEEFVYDESSGSGDVKFTLELLKYVPFAPAKLKVVKKGGKSTAVKKPTTPRQNSKPAPKTYTLVKGDNLWKLAKRFLGSGTRYREIANLNKIKDSQFRRLPIGLKVKIPPK